MIKSDLVYDAALCQAIPEEGCHNSSVWTEPPHCSTDACFSAKGAQLTARITRPLISKSWIRCWTSYIDAFLCLYADFEQFINKCSQFLHWTFNAEGNSGLWGQIFIGRTSVLMPIFFSRTSLSTLTVPTLPAVKQGELFLLTFLTCHHLCCFLQW